MAWSHRTLKHSLNIYIKIVKQHALKRRLLGSIKVPGFCCFFNKKIKKKKGIRDIHTLQAREDSGESRTWKPHHKETERATASETKRAGVRFPALSDYSLLLSSSAVITGVFLILSYGIELTMCGVDFSLAMNISQKFK